MYIFVQMHTHAYTQYHAFIFKHQYIQLSDIYFPYETDNITITRYKFRAIFFVDS